MKSSRRTQVTVIGITATALIALTTTATVLLKRSRSPRLALSECDPDIPFLVVHRYPGYVGPRSATGSGLIAAVWRNGRIVRASTEDDIGQVYMEGRLATEKLDGLVSYLNASGVMTEPEEDTLLVLDAASDHVYVHLPHRILHAAESLPRKGETAIRDLEFVLLDMEIEEAKPATGRWVRPHLPREWFEK